MNIALLTQGMQGLSGSTSETGDAPQGMFLELLSSMLGSTNPLLSLEENADKESNGSLTGETIDVDGLQEQLETWLQQPETLQWLKTLPKDAYRSFMDAYIGLLAQLAPVSTSEMTAIPEAPSQIGMQATASSVMSTLIQPNGKSAGGEVASKVEQNVQTLRQIVSQFSGTLGQSSKPLPFQAKPEPLTTSGPVQDKAVTDWVPKGLNWSKPQIDAESVMYASKGSLPENLQARIEAALQKAPFKSGADGSKVFTVRLYPEQLGELVVKLERQNGELVVKLFASNQEAKQLLQSQVQQLQQTLHPLSQQVRVEVSMTQQALDVKSNLFDGSDHPDSEQPQEHAKGEAEDDDHPTEDE